MAAAHVRLTTRDPTYPSRLRRLEDPPAAITSRGGSLEAELVLAIVGSRAATQEAELFARTLARESVEAGIVVVSGGAIGIDAAAHRGALEGGGRTWVVAGTGHQHCFPPIHRPLFDEIGSGPGAMIWPFAPRVRAAFPSRNRVLIALADAVVVVQASLGSGALHAASWARRLRRPLWVVPACPWMPEFAGSLSLLDSGAKPLSSNRVLLQSLQALRQAPAPRSILPSESRVLDALEDAPTHLDTVVSRCGETVQATAAALLTLALENVVVEGPQGFFRRRDRRRS